MCSLSKSNNDVFTVAAKDIFEWGGGDKPIYEGL